MTHPNLDFMIQECDATAADGLRICRQVTRRYAKTFYLASHFLPREVRNHAYAVYGFCRWADNAVDEAGTSDEARLNLERVRSMLEVAYSDNPAASGLLAFRRTIRMREIPKPLFDALLDGMEMDLTTHRYPDFPALELYCYRVAGVVGRMMAHVFGYRHERCFPHAEALGTAMQLTNILRDVREDLDRGRVYLPQDELARFGVTEGQLAMGQVDDKLRQLMRFQIDRARKYYREAEAGIADLDGVAARITVRVMGRLYAGILDAIENLDHDVFQSRARVSRTRKLGLVSICLRDEVRAPR